MNILSWIIFGALAGWIASIITGRNSRQGCIGNIVVGIIGAFVGGLLIGLLRGGDRMTLGMFEWSWFSFFVAVVGAVVFLFVLGIVRRN